MIRAIQLVSAAALAFSVTGCALFPANVQNPSDDDQLRDNPALHTYQGVRPVADTQPKLTLQFDAYVGTWRKAEHDLYVQLNGAEIFQFTSLVWSAYKTATGHLHDAKWGIAGAGGVSLLTDKFQIENQAHTYSNAADAMSCIRDKVQDVPENYWALYKSNSFTVHHDDLTAYLETYQKDTKEDAQKAFEAMGGLYGNINTHMSEVESRLRGGLEKTHINVPNSDDILKATQKQVQAQADASSGAKALNTSLNARQTEFDKVRSEIAEVKSAQSVAAYANRAVNDAGTQYSTATRRVQDALSSQINTDSVRSDAPITLLRKGTLAGKRSTLSGDALDVEVQNSQQGLSEELRKYFASLENSPFGATFFAPPSIGTYLQPYSGSLLLARDNLVKARATQVEAKTNLTTKQAALSAKLATVRLRGADAKAADLALDPDHPDVTAIAQRSEDSSDLGAISDSTWAKVIALPSVLDTCVTKIASP